MTGWFGRILVVTVLLQTAVYAIRPMVSYQALSIGAGNFELGVIASAYASLSLLVAVPIGRWVDRWGEPRFVVGGAVAITGVSLALVFIDNLVALAVSQAALGFGHIMSVVGTQTLIANRGAPDRRDARFGLFTVIVSIGQLAGPALAGLIAGGTVPSAPGTGPSTEPAGSDFGAVFMSSVAITFLATLAALTIRHQTMVSPAQPMDPGSAKHSSEPSGPAPAPDLLGEVEQTPIAGREIRRGSSWHALGRVLRIPSMPHAMIASLTVLTTIDLLAVYLPAYGEARGLSVRTVGLLLAVRAAASMASRLLMLPLIQLLGRRWLLFGSILMPAVALGLLPITDSVAVLYVAMAVAGFGLGLGQPITLAWVADRAPADIRGTALGVRLSGNRLGQMVLPLAVGAIAGASGLGAVFVSMSVLLAISAMAVLTASFGHVDRSD